MTRWYEKYTQIKKVSKTVAKQKNVIIFHQTIYKPLNYIETAYLSENIKIASTKSSQKCQLFGLLHLFKKTQLAFKNTPIEQHILDTNAWKQLSLAAAGVLLTLVLKKWTTFIYWLELSPPDVSNWEQMLVFKQ